MDYKIKTADTKSTDNENILVASELCGSRPQMSVVPYACLRGESKVQLADGTWQIVENLVRARFSGEVRALFGDTVVNRRVIDWHTRKACESEWFRLQTSTTKSHSKGLSGPIFAPDQKVLTTRGMVRVDELELGKDRILTEEKRLTEDQMSVVLASLLGDGGISRRNTSRAGLNFSQHLVRAGYVRWKAEVLSTVFDFKEKKIGHIIAQHSNYTRQVVDISERFPRHGIDQHCRYKLIISDDVLDRLGPLGLAVWYQDDGVFTRDHSCRIICTKLTTQEIELVERRFCQQFGKIHYDRGQGALMFSRMASVAFLDHVAGFMHPDCRYKTDRQVVGDRLPEVDCEPRELFAEIVRDRIPVPVGRRKGRKTRYGLTVEDAVGFLTPIGFVMNFDDLEAIRRAAFSERVFKALCRLVPASKIEFRKVLPGISSIYSGELTAEFYIEEFQFGVELVGSQSPEAQSETKDHEHLKVDGRLINTCVETNGVTIVRIRETITRTPLRRNLLNGIRRSRPSFAPLNPSNALNTNGPAHRGIARGETRDRPGPQ